MQRRIGWVVVCGLLAGFAGVADAQQLGGAQNRPGMGGMGMGMGMGAPGMGAPGAGAPGMGAQGMGAQGMDQYRLPGMGMGTGMDGRQVPGMQDRLDDGRTPARPRARQGNQPQQRPGRNGNDG